MYSGKPPSYDGVGIRGACRGNPSSPTGCPKGTPVGPRASFRDNYREIPRHATALHGIPWAPAGTIGNTHGIPWDTVKIGRDRRFELSLKSSVTLVLM